MKKLLFVFFLSLLICSIQKTPAQIFDKIKKETEKKIIKEAEKQLESDKKSSENEKDSVKSKDIKDNKIDESVTKETENNAPAVINSKYDFVPGEKIIFFDDFTAENVG